MKKLIALSVALALMASVAFAEIQVGYFGQIAFVPLVLAKAGDGADTVQSGVITSPWYGYWHTYGAEPKMPRLAVLIGGYNKTGTIGFALELRPDDAIIPAVLETEKFIGFGDYAEIWVRPLASLKLDFGRFRVDTFRGKTNDGTDLYQFLSYTGSAGNGDTIFARIDHGTGLDGAALTITPVPGLTAVLNFQNVLAGSGSYLYEDKGGANKVEWAKDFQFAIGYDLGVGLARAQVYNDTLQAAFALTGTDNLVVDAGITIPTGDNAGNSVTLSAAAILSGPLSLTSQVTLNVADDTKLGIYAEPSIVVGPVSVGAGVNLGVSSADDSGLDVGLGAYVQKGFKNGYVSAGVNYLTNTEVKNMLMSLPIIVTFFM